MDTCDTTFSGSHMVNEQTARQIFDVLPEEGVIVAIMDRDGTCWTSDSEAFARLGLDEPSLAELRGRVDDGAEPVIVRLGDASVTMAQLTTEQTNCGYAIVALPRSTSRPVISDANLLEAFLGQISLIARLVEKDRLLMKAQIGYLSGLQTDEISMN
jgi:hypothetical protein